MRIRRGEMYKNEMLKERKKKLNYANRALCRWLAGPDRCRGEGNWKLRGKVTSLMIVFVHDVCWSGFLEFFDRIYGNPLEGLNFHHTRREKKMK